MKKCQKMPDFTCLVCDFSCSKQSNFNNHNITRKHINAAKKSEMETLETNWKQMETGMHILQPNCQNKCIICNKIYKTRSGLWKHSQNCFPEQQPTSEPLSNEKTDMVMSILKQNEEFKSLIVEQNARIIELMNTKNTVTHIINNNDNKTINNQFNLNLFLNETCRDAMNINEFIENIEIQMKELENVANNGYVTGITDIILSRLKQLDISKRPVHCTDLKRETLYIKDKNEWNRDTEENSKIKNMITKVANKNYRKIPKWREQHPECQEPENEKYDYCIKMMRNSLGEIGDEQIKLDDKIIKNIAKLVIVDKG